MGVAATDHVLAQLAAMDAELSGFSVLSIAGELESDGFKA
jgi:hypothetical protein